MAIPQSFIQELLSRVDVVDIVGKYVQLKKGGANFMGLCPFHGEKSPSFSVSPTKQFFHCFGCGKNGNAIGFLMEHAGMTFIEAVKDLAQQTGMVVPEEQQSPEDRARAAAAKAKQDSLSDVLEKAGEAYREQLKITPHAHPRYGLMIPLLLFGAVGQACFSGAAVWRVNVLVDIADRLAPL
eukprot:gene34546-42609_t